jgi:hypothetical protein
MPELTRRMRYVYGALGVIAVTALCLRGPRRAAKGVGRLIGRMKDPTFEKSSPVSTKRLEMGRQRLFRTVPKRAV